MELNFIKSEYNMGQGVSNRRRGREVVGSTVSTIDKISRARLIQTMLLSNFHANFFSKDK